MACSNSKLFLKPPFLDIVEILARAIGPLKRLWPSGPERFPLPETTAFKRDLWNLYSRNDEDFNSKKKKNKKILLWLSLCSIN
jgi:hypothetical protein